MGKAAENEKRKLRAAYYNNVASGLTVAGYILPMLTLGPVFKRLAGMVSWEGILIKSPDDMHFVTAVTAAIVALLGAYLYRATAAQIISGIED